jgi:hypothetical protein
MTFVLTVKTEEVRCVAQFIPFPGFCVALEVPEVPVEFFVESQR